MIWKPRTTTQIVRAAVLTFSVAPAMVQAAAQQQVQVTGVRLDNAFRLVGSNSSGLVVSVKVSELKPGATSNDFALVNFDDKAHRTGETACLAMRFLDGADPKPPWILLDDPAGTLARSYRAFIESHAAVAEKTRRKDLEKAGRYEFVFLLGPSVKRGALVHDEDVVHRPDPKRAPVASFDVPWP